MCLQVGEASSKRASIKRTMQAFGTSTRLPQPSAMTNMERPPIAFHSVTWLAQSSQVGSLCSNDLSISHLIAESHEVLNPLTTDLRNSPTSKNIQLLLDLENVQMDCPGPGIAQALSFTETMPPSQSPLAASCVVPMLPVDYHPSASLTDFQTIPKDLQVSPCSSGTTSPVGFWGSDISLFSNDSKVSPHLVDHESTSRDSTDLNSPVFDCKSPVTDAEDLDTAPSLDHVNESLNKDHTDPKSSSSPPVTQAGRRGSSDSGYGCDVGQPVSSNGVEPAQVVRRLRTAFTCEQLSIMEKTFKRGKYLTQSSRKKLAQKLQLSENQIKTWFQNRRMKQKRETLDVRHNSFYAANLFGLTAYASQTGQAFAPVMHGGPQAMAYAQPPLNTLAGSFSYPLPHAAQNSFGSFKAPVLPMMYPQQAPLYPSGYHEERAYPTLQVQMYPPLYPNEGLFY